MDETLLRELALVAVDAARGAGAVFADIRIGAGQRLTVISEFNRRRGSAPYMNGPELALPVGYGIRALVGGAWGFVAGHDLSPDAVVRAAERAVARARASQARQRRTLELAPTPQLSGETWTAPISVDPFTIPVGAQADRQLAALADITTIPEVYHARLDFTWHRAARVFASTEAALLVQRTTFAMPYAFVSVRPGESYPEASSEIDGFLNGAYGYEAIWQTDLSVALRDAAERAIADSKRVRSPARSVDVGRYDIILGTSAMVDVLTATIPKALDAERALGYQANRAGTSFAAPPADILGQYQIGSERLTVRADRTRPHSAATVKWDDEGVPSEEFTLVENGIVVDYMTDRQRAIDLAPAYAARDMPVRSNGCASGMASVRPAVRLPNLTIEPGREAVTEEDLIRGTKRGVYVPKLFGMSDQQVINGQFSASGEVRRIRNGQLAEPIRDMAIQFLTPAFWSSLDALGGPATVRSRFAWNGLPHSDPLQLAYSTVTTVPGRFRDVNVLNTGRTG